MINDYCAHEAGVRNLRKCLDRIFRKIVAKMEDKKITEVQKQLIYEQTEPKVDLAAKKSEVIEQGAAPVIEQGAAPVSQTGKVKVY